MFVFLSYWKNFVGTEKRVRIIHGKRAIRVRAIEVIMYFDMWIREYQGAFLVQKRNQTIIFKVCVTQFSLLKDTIEI